MLLVRGRSSTRYTFFRSKTPTTLVHPHLFSRKKTCSLINPHGFRSANKFEYNTSNGREKETKKLDIGLFSSRIFHSIIIIIMILFLLSSFCSDIPFNLFSKLAAQLCRWQLPRHGYGFRPRRALWTPPSPCPSKKHFT